MTHKLFIATGIFHPEAGGPATYLHNILPELQARAWQVRVLTYGTGDVTGYPYPLTRIPRRFLPVRLAHYALAAQPLTAWADMIYLHTTDLPLMGAHRAPRILKVVGDPAWERCIRKGWIPPDLNIDTFQTHTDSRLVRQQQAARKRQVQAMTSIIVPSEYLRRIVIGWGVPAEKIHVVYNAMPTLPAPPASSPAQARVQLGLDERPTLFVAARLTPWKGVDALIQALQTVPEVRLIVAGDGSERPRLEALAAPLGERVQFLGQIPRAQVYAYMQAADYVALYSGYEGLPHTLLEALQLGTPVIASDKGGNPEVVQNGVNGWLVPYGDGDALTHTLQVAFRGDTRARLSAQTHIGLERFTFARMVQETHAVLMRYLGRY